MNISASPNINGITGKNQPTSAGSVNYNGKRISDPETRAKLEALAARLGRSIRVTSGDRTPEYQEKLRSQGYHPAKNSMHLQGKAADIVVEGMTPQEVAPIAREVGFKGIGIYEDGHLHVDTREAPATWYQ